jgi:multiple sugar transport system permease protein
MIAHDPASASLFGSHAARRARHALIRVLVYGALTFWAIVCLFPIYWTVTTSFKSGIDVIRGHLVPWLDFAPRWIGWRSVGLSPDTIFIASNPRAQFIARFENSVIIALGASLLALALGSCAAYGLSRFRYKFGPMRNHDILFFFISQLILPPVVLALPFLILYKQLALLDTRVGMIFIYTLTVLPIVIWVMRDQFNSIPIELDEAASVDGLSAWGAFLRIIFPIALPGVVAAFILSLILTWNEYFFAAILTATDAKTLPVLVASQTSSQGIDWWSMAALSTAAIAPLVIVGIVLERYIIKGLSSGAVTGT